ncbi:MAG TPA: lysozyme inhibitor LprI family protein, partial [Rhodocyclaceae bacterium]|nr:lysozyme inhibitor LprI family protein [Rhodocyclaceae bacterium]
GMDCKKAATRIEQEICASAELLKLDDDLGKSYRAVLGQFPRAEDQGAVKQQQRHWLLRVRNLCLDKVCLTEAYQARIAFLKPERYLKDPNAQFMGLSKEGA